MRDRNALARVLDQIDGRGYPAYRQLRGRYRLGPVDLAVDHVAADPYAPPSRVRLILDREVAGIPEDLTRDAVGRMAVGDFLTRAFVRAAHRLVPSPTGTGNSGLVSIGTPGQEVLERTGVLIADDRVEARIVVGLPAHGRRIDGRGAARLLIDVLPRIAEEALRFRNLDGAALRDHVTLCRDQEHLRHLLTERGLVAFVGDGAILPRRSGDSDLPLGDGAVPFRTPDSLRVLVELPSGRSVTGMGIPEGVTVIVGGGYHGKSTLLRAIERGIHPHIAGDGREWVITRRDAVTIRAEDERAVTGVDISPFITNLPTGADTRSFSTTSASGSTSQAANLVEAVDAGASVLLIDEDTSATNFMIRDERMRRLIPAAEEPITPFVDRVRPLFTEKGVSTILVAGGSGAFFDVADHVVAFHAYQPRDVTAEARGIARTSTPAAPGPVFAARSAPRVLTRGSLTSSGGGKPARARGRAAIQVGDGTIDLQAVAQLVDAAQTVAVAHALERIAELVADRDLPLPEAVAEVCRRIDEEGLDWLSPFRGHPGHLTRPRPHEIHAAVNRYRGLRLG
ncbi:ABC-ATPase domain-containing protein [Arachnia propionica]|uniref:ATPase n=1 Tax=Arachnia propionica TaxID=1750 RepID=A0A3P1WTY8_9ACTN|nr:ABC-ATPase domain-containing protein [Arachnia propionica]RRD49398.1 ATPase [Arachnia propionica]